jgi:PKD repeat protein
VKVVSLATSLVLLAVILSGCANTTGKAGDDKIASEDDHQGEVIGNLTDEVQDGNVTGNQTEPLPNTPPVANLTVNKINGSVPLNVTFTLNGTDEDGDGLNWTLSYGDGNSTNGITLPANKTYSFTKVGNFTVTFSVTDGTNTTNATVTIKAEPAPVAGPNICHRTPTQNVGNQIYTINEGGTWVFQETNGIPGLQVGNTFIIPALASQGFINAAWVGCVQADTMLF